MKDNNISILETRNTKQSIIYNQHTENIQAVT